MKRYLFSFCFIAMVALGAAPLRAQMKTETQKAWDKYIETTTDRMESELKQVDDCVFLRCKIKPMDKLTSAEVLTKQIATQDIPNGTIHHWFGAVFIRGAKLDQVLRWVQDYDKYPGRFEEVKKASASQPAPDTFDVNLRLTRTKYHVTVHYNTTHHVVYRRWGDKRASSRSESKKIAQLEKVDTPEERELPDGEDSGYLWKLNSYWRFSETEGGVLVETETIGLSRALGSWTKIASTIARFVSFGYVSAEKIAEEVARESLESTLTAIRDGIRGADIKTKRGSK